MTTTSAVQHVLIYFPETRRNSGLLFAKVCEYLGINFPEEAEIAPRPETVGRLAHRIKTLYGWEYETV